MFVTQPETPFAAQPGDPSAIRRSSKRVSCRFVPCVCGFAHVRAASACGARDVRGICAERAGADAPAAARDERESPGAYRPHDRRDLHAIGGRSRGGGGFLRFRSGQALQKNSEIAFFFDGTYYLNQKLGLTGEIRGAYGNAKIGNTIFNIPNPQISEYPYLFGPTYRLYVRERYAVSGFALGGAAIGKFDSDTKGIPAQNLGLWPSTSAHAGVFARRESRSQRVSEHCVPYRAKLHGDDVRRHTPEQLRVQYGHGVPVRSPEVVRGRVPRCGRWGRPVAHFSCAPGVW